MKYNKIDSKDALLLVRSMGLLLNQAAVYGPVHNVTNAASKRVYLELRENLDRYGPLEFSVNNTLICINGKSGEIDAATSASLIRRLTQLDLDGLLFSSSLTEKEFKTAVKILAMPLALIAQGAGVAELFKREGVQAVSVVKVDYLRIRDAEEEREGVGVDGAYDILADPEVNAAAGGGGVIDLSDALTGDDFNLEEPETEDDYAKIRDQRAVQSRALASLLRETAQVLEQNSTDSPEKQLKLVSEALEQIKSALAVMAQGSQVSISQLAQQVNDDKFMVAGIEEEARMQGYPLRLTREDLLTRYAELNQELVQPLTVSTGVIDMLLGATVGDVNESQQGLLRMAQEGIERVNQLVAYMHGISGLPSSYTPDMDLINDTR